MDKELKIAALSFIALLVIIAIMQPVISSYDYSGFSELAVLGPNQNLGDYPRQLCSSSEQASGACFTCCVAAQPFILYGYIENHEGYTQLYQFEIKLGNKSTQISNTTAANAPIIFTNSTLVPNNQSTMFPIVLSLTSIGNNQRLIFELWIYNTRQTAFVYTGVWNEIWVNVTTP